MKRSTKKGDIGEQIVIDELNKDKDSYLINNLILLGENGVSHQFDHILIRNNGVFVIETKNYYGQIKGALEETMWEKSFIKRGRLVSERFMNPLKQNNAHIRFLKKVLGRDVPFFNFVVFVNNDVSNLGIYNVVNLDKLLLRIMTCESDKMLTANEMKALNDKLLLLEADIQTDDHVDNIQDLKRKRREKQQDIKMVLEKSICPMCGSKISMNKNVYLCPRCKYKLVI